MLAERTRSLPQRLIGGALAATLMAVTFGTSGAGAADDSVLESTSAVFTVDEATPLTSAEDGRHEAALTTGSALLRPDFTYTACPEITDSIYRLYTSYFSRVPEQGGFEFWTTEYSLGNWSLPRMSQFFSESPEFQQLYGSRDDGQFVDLVYANVMGRLPDEGGRQYWLDQMANQGMTRGELMLMFSESPEYIELTQTWVPLSGYFNHYPEGTIFDCGLGFTEFDLPAGGTFLDLAIFNGEDQPTQFSIAELVDGEWRVVLHDTLDPGVFRIWFGIDLTGSGVQRIQVGTGSDRLFWTVTMSPTITPPTRAGWTPV